MHLCKAGTGDGQSLPALEAGKLLLDPNEVVPPRGAVADGGLNTSCIGREQIIANHLNAIF